MYTFLSSRAPKAGTIYNEATSATYLTRAFPAGFNGRVIFTAIYVDIFVQVGASSSITASSSATASANGTALTAAANSSVYIPAGTAREFVLGSTDTYFSVVSPASGGYYSLESSEVFS